MLILIKEQNSQILNILQKQQTVGDIVSFDKDLPFKLPLNTMDEVAHMEQTLETEETFNSLVNVHLGFHFKIY